MITSTRTASPRFPPLRRGGAVGGRLPVRPQHAIVALVAAGSVTLAMANGGRSPSVHAGAAILAWWAVAVGLVTGLLPRSRPSRAALAAGACLAALTAIGGLSMAWASDDGRAFTEVVRSSGYLGIFTLAVLSAPSGSASLWLRGLALGLAAVALLALGSRLEPELFPAYDLAEYLPREAGRLSYPIGYWNGLAALMALLVVLLAWLGGHAGTRAGRAAAVGLIPMALLTQYFTLSRGGPAAMLLGLIALVAVVRARSMTVAGLAVGVAGGAALIAMAGARDELVNGPLDSPAALAQGDEMLAAVLLCVAASVAIRYALDPALTRVRLEARVGRAVAVAAAVAACAAVIAADPVGRVEAFTTVPDPAEQFNFESSRLTTSAGSGRWQYWAAAWAAFETEPLTGIGLGGYEAWWARHGALPNFIVNAHSLPIETLAELGVPGFLCVMGLFAAALTAAAARLRRHEDGSEPERELLASTRASVAAGLALLVCGAASASIDWTWELMAAFTPVLLAAAVVTGPATAPRLGPRRRSPLGVLTVVVATVAVAAAAVSLYARTELDGSRAAVRAGDLDDAAARARTARSVQPWAAAPRLQLALVEEVGGDLAAARGHLDDAIERSPEDWRVWFIAARVREAQGDAVGAAAAMERARMLNPRSGLFAAG